MHHCMQESLICIRALKLNFPSYQWIAQEHGKLYYIYRDDYSEAGRRICKELEANFGGPKCAATTSEAQIACSENTYNARTNASKQTTCLRCPERTSTDYTAEEKAVFTRLCH